MVYCMSALLLHMSNFYFYIISSFHLRCSEPRVVGLINTVIIVTYFAWVQHSAFDIVIVMCEGTVSKLQTLRYIVCERYEYTCLTVIFLYFVVPFAMFCTMGRFMVLADCQCIEHCIINVSSKKHNISKGKCNILEILILLFDFSYFYVELF